VKTAVIVCASLIFTISVVLGGWILLPGVPRPASYETINRKTILLFEEVLSESPITYRSGHYTSLMQYSGSFSDILKPGAIILYKTNAGNYGKMKITGYAYYHAWSKAQNYQYCDVPFFEFTTYDDSGSVLVTGGFPIILDSIVRVVDQSPLWGIGPVGPHFYATYATRTTANARPTPALCGSTSTSTRNRPDSSATTTASPSLAPTSITLKPRRAPASSQPRAPYSR